MTGRLTRRERAAMTLALAVLRGGICGRGPMDHDALIVLEIAAEHGCTECSAIKRDASEARRDVIRTAYLHGQTVRRIRLVLCRLALYLRARLRADRGDCGPVDVERRIWRSPDGGRWECLRMDGARVDLRSASGVRSVGPIADFIAEGWRAPRRRIAPLWQRARSAT